MTADRLAPDAPGASSSHGERAVPYSCPFCAEEDLRPVPAGAVDGLARGGWHCRSCLRVFTLTFHGVHPAATSSVQTREPAS